MNIFDSLLSPFGLVRKPVVQEAEVLPANTLDRSKLIQEISSGISYDIRAYQNWLSRYWDPNPVHRSGKWTGYQVYQDMDADAKIYNCMSLAKETVIARNYYVRSARPGDKKEDFKAAFVAWNLDHIKQLQQKKREMLSCLDNGFSVSEMIIGYADVDISAKTTKKNGITTTIEGGSLKDAVVIKDIKTKVPSAFSFDAVGNLLMSNSVDPNMPLATGHRLLNSDELLHFLVFTHDPRHGSRYGWPLKASFFWDYLMKKAAKIFRMIFVEKYGMPFLVGTYPDDSDPSSIQEFQLRISGAQKNSWLTKPEGFAIELVKAVDNPGTMDVYEKLLDFCDGNISEVCLGHRHATDTAAVGSSGSAEVKEAALRQDKLEMLAGEFDAVFNDQLIPRLIDWNFEPNGLYPYVITDVQPEADKNKRIFQFATASNLGMDLSKSQIRDEIKLNEPDDEEDTLRPVGVDMSPTDFQERGKSDANDVTGGENMKNEEIADGIMKTKEELSTQIERNRIQFAETFEEWEKSQAERLEKLNEKINIANARRKTIKNLVRDDNNVITGVIETTE